MINKRLVLILICLTLGVGCASNNTADINCFRYILDPSMSYQISYQNRNISFNAPLLSKKNSDFVYDEFQQNTWETCSLPSSQKARTFYLNLSGLWGIIRMEYVDYNEPEKKDKKKGAKVTAPESAEERYNAIQAEVEKENRKRQAILAENSEEAWKKELATHSMDALINSPEIGWVDGEPITYKRYYKTRAEQEAAVKDFFKGSSERRKEMYRGLPDNSVNEVVIKGQQCSQYDDYTRLPTPLGQYATSTGGGIEHQRIYDCGLDDSMLLRIKLHFKVGVNVSVDFDAMLKPVFNSINWHATPIAHASSTVTQS